MILKARQLECPFWCLYATFSDNTATCTTSTGRGECTSVWSAVWTSSPLRPSMTPARAGLPSLMSLTKRTFAKDKTLPEVSCLFLLLLTASAQGRGWFPLSKEQIFFLKPVLSDWQIHELWEKWFFKYILIPVGGNLLRIIADPSLIRTEVSCKECGSHLGHVFEVKYFTKINEYLPTHILHNTYWSFLRTAQSRRASATALTRPASTLSPRPPPTQWTEGRSHPRSQSPSSPVQQHSEGAEVRISWMS